MLLKLKNEPGQLGTGLGLVVLLLRLFAGWLAFSGWLEENEPERSSGGRWDEFQRHVEAFSVLEREGHADASPDLLVAISDVDESFEPSCVFAFHPILRFGFARA